MKPRKNVFFSFFMVFILKYDLSIFPTILVLYIVFVYFSHYFSDFTEMKRFVLMSLIQMKHCCHPQAERSGARQRASPWQRAGSQLCAINDPIYRISCIITLKTTVWFHHATHNILFNSTGSLNYPYISVESTVLITDTSLYIHY